MQDRNLQVGDRIVKLNDESVVGMPHQEVVEKLRKLNDEADSITLSVMREEYSDKAVKVQQLNARVPP